MSRDTDWFLKAIGSFPQRLMVISPEFEIVASNELGESGGNAIGRKCYDVYHCRQTPCEHCAVLNVMESGKPNLKPRPQYSGDSRRVPCYFSYPIVDANDEVEAYVTVDFDVPTLALVEEQQKHSQAFLQNLILSAADCVIAADHNGRILIYNDSAEEVFGYLAEEAVQSLNVRNIYEEGVAYQVMRRLRAADPDGEGKLRAYHTDIVAKNGERIPISLNASIVYEGNREVATIGYFHDRREQIRLEKEMEQTQLQAQQAEKMASLGKLAAGVAHQLNNPLGGIVLYAKLVIEEYDLQEGAREDLERVLSDARRCRDTVKELLEFARQTRHLMHAHDINQAVGRTLFLLENQVLFQNIKVEKALAESLPEAWVDMQQINHLLMNIILNAAQAMEGRGRLRVSTSYLADSDCIRIEVADTGPGIPAAVLPQIFDPFFTTKGEGDGTGLGLSLVYGIVKDHHGSIVAKNRPEGGAAFVVELPVAGPSNGEDARGKST
jgi:PAS domain S-box-containing protein